MKSSKAQLGFISKLHSMVDNSHLQHLISWSSNGLYFTVHNHSEFSKTVLPNFFKHSNWQSFVRQLNMYGFHKVNDMFSSSNIPDKSSTSWEFQHPDFQRDAPERIRHIKRKPVNRNHPRSKSRDPSTVQLESLQSPSPPQEDRQDTADELDSPLPPSTPNFHPQIFHHHQQPHSRRTLPIPFASNVRRPATSDARFEKHPPLSLQTVQDLSYDIPPRPTSNPLSSSNSINVDNEPPPPSDLSTSSSSSHLQPRSRPRPSSSHQDYSYRQMSPSPLAPRSLPLPINHHIISNANSNVNNVNNVNNDALELQRALSVMDNRLMELTWDMYHIRNEALRDREQTVQVLKSVMNAVVQVAEYGVDSKKEETFGVIENAKRRLMELDYQLENQKKRHSDRSESTSRFAFNVHPQHQHPYGHSSSLSEFSRDKHSLSIPSFTNRSSSSGVNDNNHRNSNVTTSFHLPPPVKSNYDDFTFQQPSPPPSMSAMSSHGNQNPRMTLPPVRDLMNDVDSISTGPSPYAN